MDQNLTQLRDQIDGIDQKLVELFKQRMAVSRQVAAYKQEHGLPTLDVSRERALLAKVGSLAGDDTGMLIMRDSASAEAFCSEAHKLLE